MSKTIIIIAVIIILGALGFYAFNQTPKSPATLSGNQEQSDNRPMEADNSEMANRAIVTGNETTSDNQTNAGQGLSVTKDSLTGSTRNSEISSQGTLVGGRREFSLDSYYDQNTSRAVFTLGEMVVKKGEKVKVNVRNTFGKHNFTIDELDVKVETPQDETTVVEFTPTEVGEYVYYCSKPNHRSLGQWGILKVLDQ